MNKTKSVKTILSVDPAGRYERKWCFGQTEVLLTNEFELTNAINSSINRMALQTFKSHVIHVADDPNALSSLKFSFHHLTPKGSITCES